MVVRVSEEQMPYIEEWLTDFDEGSLLNQKEEIMSKKTQDRKKLD
jgi:predicted transcriptional regulator